MKLDKNQQTAAETTEKRVLCTAVPGSGKTRTLVARFHHMTEKMGIAPHNIVLLTFTRFAANEMMARIGREANKAFVGTFHAFSLKLIEMYGSERGWNPAWLTILDEEECWLEEEDALKNAGIINISGKWTACTPYYWEKYRNSKLSGSPLPADFPEETAKRLELAWQSFYRRLHAENCLTYGTMILEALALVQGPSGAILRERFQHFLVDEAQDSDQCHPPGTLIRVFDGYYPGKGRGIRTKDVPIESLQNSDRVIAWKRRWGQLEKKGRPVTVGQRFYRGNLVEVTCGKKKVCMTPDHRVYAMLNGNGENHHVVYLMWRHEYGFRVGRCLLRYCVNTQHRSLGGVGERFREEKADKGWILKILKTKEEALGWEHIISCNYGIPTLRYEDSGYSPHEPNHPKYVRFVFDSVRSRSENLFSDLDLSFERPLFTRNNVGNKKGPTKRYFETTAENLLPGIMSMPSDLPMTPAKIDAIKRISYEGPVYSLNVEKHHTYVANGIVVRNCQWDLIHTFQPKTLFIVGDQDQSIYSWRNARPDLFLSYAEGATVYPLPNSYRFGFNIASPANKLIKHNVNRIDIAIEAIAGNQGTVQTVKNAQYDDVAGILQEELKDHKPEEIAVLARRHATLEMLGNALDSKKIPYTKIGGDDDITKRPDFRTVKAFLRLAVNPLDNRAFMTVSLTLGIKTEELWDIRTVAMMHNCSLLQATRTFKDTLPKDYDTLKVWLPANDKNHCYDMIFSYLNDIIFKEAIVDTAELVRYISLTDIQDQLASVKESIVLSTAHASKGLEWPVVVVLGMNSNEWPSPRSVRAGGIEEERRLLYVAMTRAESKLYLVSNIPERPKDGQSMFFDEMGQLDAKLTAIEQDNLRM